MNLYTAIILKEGNKYFLKTGSANFIGEEVLSKLEYITQFIQKNIFESQIIWHYEENIPLLEIQLIEDKFVINSPYLKFLYNMPLWKIRLKTALNMLEKEYDLLDQQAI